MTGIFAIIATTRQAIFAIVAIDAFANIANNSNMKDLNHENKLWLVEKLRAAPRGTRTRLAGALEKTPDTVTRMANISESGESRIISLPELHILAKFFNDTPPGLIGAVEAGPPPERRSREISRIRLLDHVPAGRLRQPLSQIPPGGEYLSLVDLGRGEFFALTVEGDSMDRIIPEGARVIVDEADRTLVSGKPYVISNRGETTLKLWKPSPPRWAPYSNNPIHEPIYVKNKEAAERMVVGRVKRAVLEL
jgi:SOS-response transcriptional repressor LexA